ncbi:MAG: Sulfate permease 2 [Watsoniomyces obsoletus]|nr:MAG: Sulfate permease 2 [Watsoniomyces obsoletus]
MPMEPSMNNNTPSSQRAPRTLRKLKSAHVLSSHASNANLSSTTSSRPPPPRSTAFLHRELPPMSNHPPPLPHSTSHSRTRSNSDAAAFGMSTNSQQLRNHAAPKRVVTAGLNGNTKNMTLDALLRDGPRNGNIKEGLECMRYQVLSNGVGSDHDGMSSLRIYVWLVLLCAPPIPTDDYLALVHRGPSPAYAKIRNDTFRTLATDPLFRRRVSEASLIRLLNAVAWTLHDRKEEEKRIKSSVMNTATEDGSPEMRHILPVMRRGGGSEWDFRQPDDQEHSSTAGTYVQGMNVIAAPFLYAARSEAEAFVAFQRFISLECPGYVRGAMDGVHRGLALVDKTLGIVDPKLFAYLMSKSMHAELYAFPSVLTLCACTPPLPEVLHLWDFLFAYGAHLNILCIVAQLIMMRDTILDNPSPVKILRSFPPLNAARIKALAVSLVSKIPDQLYDEIVKHAK